MSAFGRHQLRNRRRIVGPGRQAISRLEWDAKFLALASGVPNSLQAVQGSPATPDRAQYRTTEPPDLDRHPAATGTGRVPIWIAPARSPAPTWSDTPGKRGGKAHSEGRTPTPSASAPAAPSATPTTSVPAASMPTTGPTRFGAAGRESQKAGDQRNTCEKLHEL